MLIGITGLFGSGKSTASEIVVSHAFQKIELSSYLVKVAKRRNLRINRHNLQNLGDEFREEMGKDILMKKALKSIESKKVLIDGIRNPSEVKLLKKHGGVLVAIVCVRMRRYERVLNSEKHKNITFKQFDRLDLRDLGINEKISGLQTGICIGLADYFIDNNCNNQIYKQKIEDFIKKYA